MTDDVMDDDHYVADLLAFCEEIGALDGVERHAALVRWARSADFSPILMMETRVGALAREAMNALIADMSADTAGKAWWDADFKRGLESIKRLLGVEGHEKALYATLPFRTVNHDDRDWIAAAIPPMPLMGEQASRWRHIDIDDLILWCPRTGDVRLWGEHASATRMLLPEIIGDELTVYADPFAFFRDWAANRVASHDSFSGDWPDGFMPGALVVGDISRLAWPHLTTQRVVAGPGCEASELRQCAMRAANLPTFTGGGRARV